MKALLDSSGFIMWQQISNAMNFDIFKKLDELEGVEFKIMNDVWVELSQKESEKVMDRFLKNIVNASASYSRNHRFQTSVMLGDDGRPYASRHNKISGVDWAQIQTCQSHKDLILVTNDKKLLKSAATILHGRVNNPIEFLLKVAVSHPKDGDLKRIVTVLKQIEMKPL